VAFTEGDAEAACKLLTPERRQELIARSRRPTCERAVALQAGQNKLSDLDRLGRAKVTKVALTGATGTAEVLTPADRKTAAESHTVRVKEIQRRWRRLASRYG
jgi:hypothetical protein